MVGKPKTKVERCLHCQAPQEAIICDGCRTLLRQPEYACKCCAQPLDSAALVCGRCQKKPPEFTATYSASVYTHPIDWWVHALKFNDQLAYARLMAHCMEPQLRSLGQDIPLIPVPLHRRRYLQRGYNQAQEIARELSRLTGNPVLSDVLVRTRHTQMQSELSGKKRISNVRAAFQLDKDIDAKHVLLVDDVMTTGHTMRACADAFKQADIRVDVLVFARA